MAVTDEDRAKARAMYDSWFGGDEMDDEIIGDIAEALAAEREKARAPFLALADEMDSWDDDSPDARSAYAHAADEIRQAVQAEP